MQWMLFAALSAVCAGLIPVMAKRDPSQLDPTHAMVLRALVMTASLIMCSALLGRFRQLPLLDRPTLSHVALSGLACAASWIFYFLALKTGPAAKVVAIDRTSAAFTLVLAALLLGEAMTWRSVVGIGMILIGTFVTLRS